MIPVSSVNSWLMKDPARVPGLGGGVIQEGATWLKSKVAESPFCVPQVGVRESLALATIEMICAQIFPPPIFSCTHPPLALKPVFGLGPDRVPVPFCVSFCGFQRGFQPFSSVAPKSKPLEPYNFFSLLSLFLCLLVWCPFRNGLQ